MPSRRVLPAPLSDREYVSFIAGMIECMANQPLTTDLSGRARNNLASLATADHSREEESIPDDILVSTSSKRLYGIPAHKQLEPAGSFITMKRSSHKSARLNGQEGSQSLLGSQLVAIEEDIEVPVRYCEKDLFWIETSR